MLIAAVADVHGSLVRMPELAPLLAAADVLVIAGDLTHFGGKEQAAQVLDALRPHARRILAVAGNCDLPEVARHLCELGVSLHGRHEVLDGVAFVGAGGSLPCPGHTPNELSEAELQSVLEQAVKGLDPSLPLVLVCHQPPIDTALDVVRSGLHVGSKSIRQFIETRRPLLCLTGHIHEAAGKDVLGRTVLLNPGPLRGGRCAWAEVCADGLRAAEIRPL